MTWNHHNHGDDGDDGDDENLGEEHSKTKKETSSEVLKQELRWNKKRERSFYKGYGSGSRLIRKREKKSA